MRRWSKRGFCRAALFTAVAVVVAADGKAETGYNLWLRYERVTDAPLLQAYRASVTAIVARPASPASRMASAELQRGLHGLLGVRMPVANRIRGDGALVIGTPSNSPVVAALGWLNDLTPLGRDGYLIRSTRAGGHAATVIASTGESGALHGAFHFLRLIQTRQPVTSLDIAARPRLERRLLNHWDNLDGTIERGYAGPSLW
jgi:alpha-glucuronidase